MFSVGLCKNCLVTKETDETRPETYVHALFVTFQRGFTELRDRNEKQNWYHSVWPGTTQMTPAYMKLILNLFPNFRTDLIREPNAEGFIDTINPIPGTSRTCARVLAQCIAEFGFHGWG